MKNPPKLEKLAYTLQEFAEAVSLSDEQLRYHIKRNELVPRYSGTKPLITVAEGERFLRSLPEERVSGFRA